MPRLIAALSLCWWLAVANATEILPTLRLLPVDQVWSGHPVDFALIGTRRAHDGYVVSYYDDERRLTVASLKTGASTFTYQRLDSVTGWDSHNYLALAEDRAGHLHLIGNMHNDPLCYFRTRRAGDVTSFERVAVLVNEQRERRMTYPVFITSPDGSLVLKYRDGGSGNGNEIYVAYDADARRWRTLLDTPLVDGEGQRNAYFMGPVQNGGYFHLTWVWRDTPDAETNHDLSYARSRDLVNWERSDGTPLKLPITLATAEIVDPVPVRAGMINNNTVLGFDHEGRPVITYHKFDRRGNTQIHLARREKRGWRSVQLTRWRDFRWDFAGRGSLQSRLEVTGVMPEGPWLVLEVKRDGETHKLRLRARDLGLLAQTRIEPLEITYRNRVRIPKDMVLNSVPLKGSFLLLMWPTMPRNRDQPRSEIPQPTRLVLGVPW